jgi:hypothetical protein
MNQRCWRARRSGAMQELAETRVNSEIASQIESLKPVKMNMGFWNFLPIEVPFLEQVVDFS